MKSHLGLVTPGTVNRTVASKWPPSADLHTREYLTEAEVERLLRATRSNRWALRDATMILVAYRHGLRASKLQTLGGIRWTSERPPCTFAGSNRAAPALQHTVRYTELSPTRFKTFWRV